MTRERCENIIEIVCFIGMILVAICVATGILQSVCWITLNGFLLLVLIATQYVLNYIDKREES